MKRRAAYVWSLLAVCAVACGTRTGLLIDGQAGIVHEGDGGIIKDASVDRSTVTDGDAPLPLIDAASHADARKDDCPDADSTLIYVVTDTSDLYSFFPPDGTFRHIGALRCPAPGGGGPFSMAVDRHGIAYVVYRDVNGGFDGLFRVSTATASCVPTSYSPPASFSTFGMGFSTDGAGPSETLYIAGASDGLLASIDVKTFTTRVIGVMSLQGVELTGTGDGRLFGFFGSGAGTAIAELDKSTAAIVAETPLDAVQLGQGWAFGFWGGDFFTFTAPGSTTVVTRIRPSDGTVTQVSSLAGGVVVGAGVSTCAPEQ